MSPNADAFLATLRERTVIKDGAMGTMVQDAKLTAADYGGHEGNVDHLSLSKPGSSATSTAPSSTPAPTTSSPTPSSPRASGWRSGGWTTRRASRTSPPRGSPARWPTSSPRRDWPRFVAGSVGPDRACCRRATTRRSRRSPTRSSSSSSASRPPALLEGGVDLLQIETMQDILETPRGGPGRPAGLRRRRPARAAAGLRRARRDRPDAARHRHRRRRAILRGDPAATSSARTAPWAPSTCASPCAT